VDFSGNALDYKVEPAFFSHRILPSLPVLSYPPADSIEIPTTVKLEWEQAFAASGYQIQISLDSTFTTVSLDDSTIASNSSTVGPLPGLTTFFWRVRSHNPIGVSDYSAFRRFTTADTMSTVAIRKGWNLVSASLGFARPERVAVYPRSISTLYAFNGISYVGQETLKIGTGYWIKFPSDESLALGGSNIPADTVSLLADWNLIGSVSVPMPVSSITSDPPGISTSPFYAYDGSFIITDTIWPGKGYWVKAYQPGSLILSSDQTQQVVSQANIRVNRTNELPPPPPDSPGAEEITVARSYSLPPNYPNPFNAATTVRFSLASTGHVSLRVYNLLGEEVALLVDEILSGGDHSIRFNGDELPSGIYIVKISASNFSTTRKMMLMK
jgi:hypothetical protein